MSLQDGIDPAAAAPPPETTPPPPAPEPSAPPERIETTTFETPKPSGRSVREHLQAEFAKARSADAEPVPKTAAPIEQTSPVPPSSAVKEASEPEIARARGPDGRFASTQPAAPTPAAAAPQVSPTEPPAKAPPAPQTAERAPPGGWPAEAKSRWLSLPPSVQEAVLKRESEVSDGFKSKSEDLKKTQERLNVTEQYAQIFERHEPWFKANGRTGPEVAARAMEWLLAFGSRDAGERKRAHDAIAVAFNIPTSQQPSAAPAAPTAPGTAPDTSGTPPAQPTADIQAQVRSLIQEAVQPLYQTVEQQRNNQILAHINAWAVDKPHYERVKVQMGHLIGNGLVPPLPDGQADLDKAYQMATWSDPDIRAELVKAETDKLTTAAAQREAELKAAAQKAEQDARVAAEAKAKADAEAKAKADATAHRQAHATQARQAGVSVGTRAPTAAPSAPNRAAQANRPVPSVRDRLMEALREHSA